MQPSQRINYETRQAAEAAGSPVLASGKGLPGTVYTMGLINLPAFVMGFPLETLAGLLAFRGIRAIYIHSNVHLYDVVQIFDPAAAQLRHCLEIAKELELDELATEVFPGYCPQGFLLEF